MFTRVLALIALVLFVVFHVLKLSGNFNYLGDNGTRIELAWIWVFSPLLYVYAINLALSIRLK